MGGASDPTWEGGVSTRGCGHPGKWGKWGIATGIIFGSSRSLFDPSAWMTIPPVSAFTSLCRPTTKHHFLHTSACSIENLAPQTSQQRGKSTNPKPYLLLIPSRHLSFSRDRPFTSVGWTKIQASVCNR